MENKVVLSGDIIASTSLSYEEKSVLENRIKNLITILATHFSIYARIIKGDYIEIVVEKPEDALTITLLLKSYIKSSDDDKENKSIRYQKFKNFGIRIAMGFGPLARYDKEKGIIDGEAIYFSGRKINEESTTYNKKRIVIKNTLFFVSAEENRNATMNTILSLLDVLMSHATAKQNQIVFWRLLGKNEKEIANLLNIKQPTVNKQLNSIGWNAIDKSVQYFKTSIQN